MIKALKKPVSKAEKQLNKGSKRLSKQLFGKKSLTLRHTYDSTLSFFGSAKEKHPLLTVSASGEYKISVFKLIVILMCILSTLFLGIMLIKSIADYRREKRMREIWDGEPYEYGDDEVVEF